MTRTIILLLTLCLALAGCAAPGKSKAEGTAQLSFHSFDGGGPTYRVQVDDPAIVSVDKSMRYIKKDHADLDGAGYNVTFTFTGLKRGTTTMTVEERSPIAGNFDHLYEVRVDEALQVTLRELTVTDLDRTAEPTATLVMETERGVLYAAFADNSSAVALRDRLSEGPIALMMADYGHFEKTGRLPWALETNDEEITTAPGDVILYRGDQLAIYYDENTWALTPLARVQNATREDMLAVLGEGDVTVLLYIEWSE